MVKPIDGFKDSVNTYNKPADTPWYEDIGNAITNTVLSPFQGMVSGAVGTAAGQAGASNEVASAVQQNVTTSGVFKQNSFLTPEQRRAGMGLAAAPLVAPIAAYDIGLRGVNTAVGGTVLTAADYLPYAVGARAITGSDAMINPLYRDGFDWGDVTETFRRTWGSDEPALDQNGQPILDADGNPVMEQNAITAGQAISTAIGRTAVSVADAFYPGNLQQELDKKIEEDTYQAILDPLNVRGLLSWQSGLHSEFDIYNKLKRESAFNQGLGRWISGSADAAIQWFAGPDVLALKVAGKAGRSLFVRSITDLQDLTKAQESLSLHKAYLAGEEGGKRTSLGRLVETLVKLDETQVLRHQIARTSTDAPLVARTFGSAKTFEEASDRLLAMSGDLQAIDRLFAQDKILGDTMRMNVEKVADLRSMADASAARVKAGSNDQAASIYDNFWIAKYQTQADRLEQVVAQARVENKRLEAAVAGLSKEAGIPDVVRFGDIRISKLPVGPNSAQRMASKAVKEADRAAGQHLWKTSVYKTGGKFGRNIRVWQSAYDYMKTSRIRGYIRLTDPNDMIAEIDASMQTLPMFRALQKQFQGDTFLPGTDMLVSDFRQMIINEATMARTATERAGVWKKYEDTMWNALAANYGLDPAQAAEIIARYSTLRQAVADTARLKGYIVDDQEIHIVSELQSLLAEGMPTMDFHFIETLFRLERGSGVSKGKAWTSLKGSKGLAAFDALWRPLVLMRLGYTTRNVAEGNLRDLALFGSMSNFYQTGMGTRALGENGFIRWARSAGNTLDRAGNLRFGSLKRARSKAEASLSLTRKARIELNNANIRMAELTDEALQMYENAGEVARKQILKEMQQAQKERVGVVWEQKSTEAYGELDAIMREAQEFIVPVDAVRPLTSGISGRRGNFVSGFEDVRTAQLQAANEAAQRRATGAIKPNDPLVPQNPLEAPISASGSYEKSIMRFLSSSDRKMFTALNKAQATGTLTPEQAAELTAIINRAQTNAAVKAMMNGDTVVRIVDPESKLFQNIHNKEDITVDDIANGNLAVLPQENLNQVEYVRANVYGGLQDLRVNYEGGMGLDSDLINSMYLIEPSKGEIEKIASEFGLRSASRIDDRPVSYQYLESLISQAQTDPELAQALQLRMFVSKLKQTESGADLAEWLESKGILISDAKLRQVTKKVNKNAELKKSLGEQYKTDLAKLTDDLASEEYWSTIPESTWMPKGAVVHGGTEVPGDIISETPPFTTNNVNNLQGIGLYSTAHAPTGGGYLIARFERVEEAMLAQSAPDFNKPAMYVVDGGPGFESKFVDLDAPMQMMPNMTPENLMDNEELVRSIVDDMLEQVGEDLNVVGDDAWEQIVALADEAFINKSNPLDPAQSGYTGPLTIEFYRNAIVDYFRENFFKAADDAYDAADYEAQLLFTEAVKGMGAYGIKHIGGARRNNPVSHQVYVWYTPPKMTPIESVSAEAVRLMNVRKNLYNIEKGLPSDAKKLAKLSVTPYKANSLDFAAMPDRAKAMIAQYMKENGIGRTLIDDSSSPSGYRMISSPDMISVSTDQIDAVLPSGVIGKDFVDKTLPQLENNALVRNPATLNAGALDDAELLQVLDGNADLIPLVRGTSNGTPQQKAMLARALEAGDYTHVQIGAANSNKFTNVSELVGNKKTGAAYGALLGEDAISQRRALILANDEAYAAKQLELDDMQSKIFGAEERLQAAERDAEEVLDRFKKRAGKRVSGEPTKSPIGSGEETFDGRFKSFTVDGPFNVNNQGSLNAQLSSSGDTQMAMLYGFTDWAMMKMRKSSAVVEYNPGDKFYFSTLADEINKGWRNDLIGMAIIRNESDEEIIKKLFETKQGRAYIRDVQGFGNFRDKVDHRILNEDARQEMSELIAERRNNFAEVVPDAELREYIKDHEVTSDFLLGQMGWRSDLPGLRSNQFVETNRGWLRDKTGSIMHILGTMPENALVRHPFFRARWRDEMQRQADLYASQGMNEFSEATLNSMNQVAKKWALKQTNETLYTIQRLSTPAHMFKFIIPFFPAWASAMRFWLLRVPIEKPENIARYAMAWNAPESAGWVYDDEGVKVQAKDSLAGRVTDKLFGGSEGSILIKTENPKLRETLTRTIGTADFKWNKGSIDALLQGETPWMPGFTPFVAIPASWLAAQMPDVATAIETGNINQLPFIGELVPQGVNDFVADRNLTRPFYRSVIPFGQPTKDKSLLDVAASYIAPAFADKAITALQGMSSAQFSASAKEIHRTRITDWELGGKVGDEPNFIDSVNDARQFWWFRAALNLTMPFATQFQSNYQFYINEGRRIDREVFDNGGTYEEANKKFIDLYGKTFFKYTKSLSAGGSGMSATVGEFKEFNRDPRLMADLARIGPDASFITMATRPFAESMNDDGFDGAVYSWQMNRKIEGALGKYIRGGDTTELPTTSANRELGWMEFQKVSDQLDAIAAARGTTVSTDEVLQNAKDAYVLRLQEEYPEWYEDYRDIGGSRYIRSNTALQRMVDAGYFEAHKDHPYSKALLTFYYGRKDFVKILQLREAAGGSASLDAKSNAPIKTFYDKWIEDLKISDPTGSFSNTFDRFFESDLLKPLPALEEKANG